MNHNYNRSVDDLCLEYKSIPMAVVQDLIKVKHPKNQYDGIKQIYNTIPPRPQNLNVMATSIARINNDVYSTAVPKITRMVAQQEVDDVRRFVNKQNLPIQNHWELNPYPQTYIPEQPTRSSSGKRLQPSQVVTQKQSYMGDVVPYDQRQLQSLILGYLPETSGVVPYQVDMDTQNNWNNSMETQTENNYTPYSQENHLQSNYTYNFVKTNSIGRHEGKGKKNLNTQTIEKGPEPVLITSPHSPFIQQIKATILKNQKEPIDDNLRLNFNTPHK
jgi:hypothetical protein